MRTQPKHERIAIFVLVLISLVGAALRWYPVSDSLWLDELHTSWTVLANDGPTLAERAQLGNNSTLYFRLVQCVTQWLGHHEWSLRIVSIISGTLLIPLTFGVCRKWCQCGILPSLLAASLVCFDRHNNFYAGEARTYALVQLVSLSHLGLLGLLLTRDNRTWPWLLWTLTGMLLFHLHCTTALFLAAEVLALALLLWIRLPIKIPIRFLLIGFGVMATSWLSNIGLLMRLAERRENWSHFISATRQPLRMIWLFPLDVYLFVPVIGAVAIWFFKQRLGVHSTDANESGDGEHVRYETPLVVCGVLLAAPVLLAWCFTELDITRIFLRRYLIASSVVLPVLTAVALSALTRGTWTRIVVSVLAFSWGLPHIWPRLEHRVAEDWRAAVPAINQQPESEPLLFYSGLIEADGWWNTQDPSRREYCEFPLRAAYRMEPARDVILLPRTVEQIPATIPLPDQASAWLLIRSDQRKKERVVATVLGALGKHWIASKQTTFGRLTLVQLLTDKDALVPSQAK